MNTRNIVLCILYLFLVPMGGLPNLRSLSCIPILKIRIWMKQYTKKSFGRHDRYGKSVDWQKATCDWFRALPEGRYLLFNPRRDKGLSGEMSGFLSIR